MSLVPFCNSLTQSCIYNSIPWIAENPLPSCEFQGNDFAKDYRSFAHQSLIVPPTVADKNWVQIVKKPLDLMSRAISSVCSKIHHLFLQTSPNLHVSRQSMKRKRIIIVPHVANGLGDLSGAEKLHRLIKRFFPQHRVEIRIHETHKKAIALFSNEIQKAISFFSSYDHEIKKDDFDLIMDYPSSGMGMNNMRTALNSPKKHFIVGEYGYKLFANLEEAVAEKFKFKKLQSLGIETNQLGVFFDHDLYQYYRSGMSLTSANRLTYLGNLPAILSKAILGEDHSSKSVEKFDASSKLYFGYSVYPVSKDVFTKMIATLAFQDPTKGQSYTPCLVLVGNPLTPFAREGVPDSLGTEKLFQELAAIGVDEVQVTSLDANLEYIVNNTIKTSDKSKNNPKRVLKVVSIQKLPHVHMKNLIKASERETLATGDQSFLEALSAGKFVVYEMLSHKRRFIEDLIEIASKIDPNFDFYVRSLFSNLNLVVDKSNGEKRVKPFMFDPTMEGVFSLQNLRIFPHLYDQFIETLYTNCNVEKNLVKVIKDMLSLDRQAVERKLPGSISPKGSLPPEKAIRK